MDLNDFKTSKFLKKDDIGEGILVTIRSITTENVSQEGVEPVLKIALHFDELEKPLICNSTNAQIVARITGVDKDVEVGWLGAKIVLYFDENVSFGGKLTGGIRIRAPRVAKQEAQNF